MRHKASCRLAALAASGAIVLGVAGFVGNAVTATASASSAWNKAQVVHLRSSSAWN